MKRGWIPGSFMRLCLACGIGLASLGCGRMDFDEPAEAQAVEMKLAYPPPGTYHALLNETRLQIKPTAQGVKKLTVSPALPPGLVLDEGTGEITGIATVAKDRTRYEVTGTSTDGTERTISAALYLTAHPGWKVTATSDWADDNNGMGTCFATMAGGCTLRAAIQSASEAGRQSGGKWLILLPAGTYEAGFINGFEVELVIAGEGAEKTVVKRAGSAAQQLMHIPSGRAVRLDNLPIQQFGPDSGGVAYVEGGRLEVFHAELAQNSAIGSGGVIYVDSGGQALLENVTFQGNKAVMNNGKGGVLGAAGVGTKITVVKSTAIGNEAKLGSFAWIDSGATLEISNSTITRNVATESAAVRVEGGSLVVKSSTLFANLISPDPTGVGSAGFYIGMAGASITLTNTIVAGNTNAEGVQRNCVTAVSDASSLISLGGNLFSNDADGCKTMMADRPQELNAKLDLDDEAKDHGGFTKTVKIQKTSAAIDRGVGECPAEDQRGLPRKPGACDVGAYEWQPSDE